jgi:hypothetical protein
MQAIYTRTMRVKDDMLGKAMEIGQGLAKVRKKYYPKHQIYFSFHASGMGVWEVNAMDAGQGDMAITYDGIAGLTDETPDSIFNKSTMHCIGGLTLQAGKFTDETGMCRFDLFDGESVYMKYVGKGSGGVGGTGTFEITKGTGKYAKITGTGVSSRQNLKSKAPGFSTSMNQMSGEYKY